MAPAMDDQQRDYEVDQVPEIEDYCWDVSDDAEILERHYDDLVPLLFAVAGELVIGTV